MRKNGIDLKHGLKRRHPLVKASNTQPKMIRISAHADGRVEKSSSEAPIDFRATSNATRRNNASSTPGAVPASATPAPVNVTNPAEAKARQRGEFAFWSKHGFLDPHHDRLRHAEAPRIIDKNENVIDEDVYAAWKYATDKASQAIDILDTYGFDGSPNTAIRNVIKLRDAVVADPSDRERVNLLYPRADNMLAEAERWKTGQKPLVPEHAKPASKMA